MASNEDIKQAAFCLFATQGYECTSMQEIAQAVGLKKQSLYSHFTGKHELYETILREQAHIIMSEIYIAIDELKEESIESIFKGVFQRLIKVFLCKERLLLWKRGFISLCQSEASVMTAQADWHFDSKLRGLLFDSVRARYDKLTQYEDFRPFFVSYMLSIQGYFDWMILKGHDEEVFQFFWNNVWNGISRYFN